MALLLFLELSNVAERETNPPPKLHVVCSVVLSLRFKRATVENVELSNRKQNNRKPTKTRSSKLACFKHPSPLSTPSFRDKHIHNSSLLSPMASVYEPPFPLFCLQDRQQIPLQINDKNNSSHDNDTQAAAWIHAHALVSTEAALRGRQTRLKERCIETTGQAGTLVTTATTGDHPWKSRGLLHMTSSSTNGKANANRVWDVIRAAARKGAATKLPERIVCNYDTTEEEEAAAAALSPSLRRSIRYWLLVSTETANSHDDNEGTCKIERAIQALKQYDAAAKHEDPSQPVSRRNTPTQPPSPLTASVATYVHRPPREFPIRPMIDLSAEVAFGAWERQARLNRPSAVPRIHDKCHCRICRTASPQQTHDAYVWHQQQLHRKQEVQSPLGEGGRQSSAPHRPLPLHTTLTTAVTPNTTNTTSRPSPSPVPHLVQWCESMLQLQHDRCSILTLPPELHVELDQQLPPLLNAASEIYCGNECGDGDESSGYTEVTVSTAEPEHDNNNNNMEVDESDTSNENDRPAPREEDFPVITLVPLQRRPSDITFDATSLLPPPRRRQPLNTAGAPPPRAVCPSESTPSTIPSSDPSTFDRSRPWRPPPPQQQQQIDRPGRRRNALLSPPRPGLSRPTTSRTTKPIRTAPRHGPAALEVVFEPRTEDVSSLTLPAYFDDTAEQAILQQFKATPHSQGHAAAVGVSKSSSNPCRFTQFLAKPLKALGA